MSACSYAKAKSEAGEWVGVGLCLRNVRAAFAVDAKYPSAQAAWDGAGGKKGADTHTLLEPPANSPVFWSGGPHGYGHIAIADGHGNVWSTDILRRGKWDKVPINTISRKWGLKYLGWSETLNGVRVTGHYTY